MKRGFERVSQNTWNLLKGESKLSIEEIKLPKRATKHAAGHDIYSTMDLILNPNDEIKMPLGWKSYMGMNECLIFIPRSGLGFKYYTRLANTLGLGDSDYYNNETNEGMYWVKIRNEGKETLIIHSGDAIAQCVFMNYLLADGDDFESGETRTGGLGSTRT